MVSISRLLYNTTSSPTYPFPDTRLLESLLAHCLDKLTCTGSSTLVGGQHFALAIDAGDSILQALLLRHVAQIVKQERAGEQHSSRIDNVLSSQIRRRPMHRLKIGVVFAITDAWGQAQAANAARSHIGQDIAMLVVEHNYIQRLRFGYHTASEIVDQEFLVGQTGSGLDHLAHDLAKAPIRARLNRVFGPQRNAAGVANRLALIGNVNSSLRHAANLLIRADAHSIGTLLTWPGRQVPALAAWQRSQFA